MDEISLVMTQFQVALKSVIDAEIKRQVGAMVAQTPVADEVKERREYAKAAPKPCPKCGTLNTARRFRFYCPEHRP